MDDQHVVVKTLRVAATAGQTGAVGGRHNLAVATRVNALLQQHPIEVFFASVQESAARTSATVAIPDLPTNVHLQTFRTSLRSADQESTVHLKRSKYAVYCIELQFRSTV